jgi:hypothetical protein
MESIMATSGTQKVFGGTQSVRYPDPRISGNANAFGLYQWSAFNAPLGTGTDTTFTLLTAGVLKDAVVNLLLFTSDVLATGLLQTDISVVNGFVKPAVSVPFLDDVSGGSDLVVPVGKVGQGYVGTVQCSGFPAKAVASTTQASTPLVSIHANSPVVASPISLQDWAATPTAASGTLPVILAAANYTAVIRDAGNQIVTAAGVVYQVVGLYSVV